MQSLREPNWRSLEGRLVFGAVRIGCARLLGWLFNYNAIFRQVNSVLFMLVALGMLVGATTKKKFGDREQLARNIAAKERELNLLKMNQERKIIAGPPPRETI